ncbi:MAG TPA: endolytic transglycosylase MltG [Cerasibacillus sp.]|uniref:endolytic transglycosylase MltG n=1 Tax=Cerasibacillus sp. TaxID=2498711 RepID=UPI002F3F04D1
MSKKNKNKSTFRDNLIARGHEARTVRKIVLIMISVIVLILLIGGISGYMYIKSALEPVNPDNEKDIHVEIPMGASSSTIAKLLEDHNIIKDSRVFRIYTKIKNESDFQAGEYDFTQAMTFDEIIESLKTGRVIKEAIYRVTIPEGLSIPEIAKIFEKEVGIKQDKFLKKVNDVSYVESLIDAYPTLLSGDILHPDIRNPLEGYLFAATYDFYEEDIPVETVIEVMLDKSNEVLGKYLDDISAKDMTVHEMTTMASMIEKEAKNKAQRRSISSVFYNRLKAGMKLQTDPTVLYALGKHKKKVLLKDLEVKSPYNTYQIDGIPVGPISNFSEDSLKAAINPDDTEFLYFLHDAEGKIYYAKTHDEHVKLKNEHIK